MNYYNDLLGCISLISSSNADKKGTNTVIMLPRNTHCSAALVDLEQIMRDSNISVQFFDYSRLKAQNISLTQLQEIRTTSLMMDTISLKELSSERIHQIDLVIVYAFASDSWTKLVAIYNGMKSAATSGLLSDSSAQE